MKKSTKVLICDAISGTGLLAGGVGLSRLGVKTLGKIWEKHELTDEFVEAHPSMAFIRMIMRILLTILVGVSIAVGPFFLLIGAINNLFETLIKDDEELK